MATQFPTDLDVLVNPQPNDSVEVISHAAQHSNANDAIEALEVKVGKDNDTNPNSLDFKVKALEQGINTNQKAAVASLLTSGTHQNILVAYDSSASKINLTATYDQAETVSAIATALTAGTGITKTSSSIPPNYIGDYDNGYSYALNDVVSIPEGSPYGIVGSYFIRSGNPLNPGYPPQPGGGPNASWTLYNFSQTITIAVDTNSIATQSYVNTAISNLVDSAPGLLDTLNEIAAAIGDDANFATTITTALATKLNITDAASTYLSKADAPEVISDTTGAMFAHSGHTNVVATYDDTTNKINLSVIAQLTQEQAQDYIAPLFVHNLNPNITATYDDEANKLILETIIPPSKAIMSATAPINPSDPEIPETTGICSNVNFVYQNLLNPILGLTNCCVDATTYDTLMRNYMILYAHQEAMRLERYTEAEYFYGIIWNLFDNCGGSQRSGTLITNPCNCS